MEPEQRSSEASQGDQQQPFRNPFRSEADAFRLLVIIGVAVAVIVAAAKLGGPWVGVPVAVIVLGLGVRASALWLKVALTERDSGAGQPLPPPD